MPTLSSKITEIDPILERRQKILIALRKAKTSLEKVIASIEAESAKECFPVIQQNLAVIGLLKSVNLLMLERHIEQEIHQWSGISETRRKELQEKIFRIVQLAQNK